VVGADFKQIDFKSVQGHGETRLASAAGVPPIIPGFSEGLSSATYSNYGQALRRFSGLTMHPLWQSAAGSLQRIFPPPPGCRLWYDTRDVPFLREDAADLSEIQQNQAATISSYISAGFTPESSVAAVVQDDPELLRHTGLVSVQLWEPGAQPVTGSSSTTDDGGNGSLAGDEPDSTPPQEQ
jgi:phage portal protein BeeE